MRNMTNGSQQNINHLSRSFALAECFSLLTFIYSIFHSTMFCYSFSLCLNKCKQGVGQTVNGEVDAAVDYAAKTHELQTIIEKQVWCT